MNQREKMLAVGVALLIVLWGASQGWDKYQAALDSNLSTQRNVAEDLSNARAATERGRRAQQKLREWSRQSLPTDPEIAKSLYQDWLQQELISAGLTVKDLTIRTPRSGANSYQQFTYTVNATGRMRQLTDFLYYFYEARHLHRISKLSLSPNNGDRQNLTIGLTIDALSLPEADREDQLAEGSSNLNVMSLEQLQEEISRRNVFASYEPPRPPVVNVNTIIDEPDREAAQARFSGINYGNGGWLMLLKMENSGQIQSFRVGDTIRVGRFIGTIEELDGNLRRAIVSDGTERLQIWLGQTLAEAQPFAETAS